MAKEHWPDTPKIHDVRDCLDPAFAYQGTVTPASHNRTLEQLRQLHWDDLIPPTYSFGRACNFGLPRQVYTPA